MLRRGSTDRNGIRDLQRALNSNGANLVVDGIFGPRTQQAVRSYQSKNGLRVDGIAGTQTLGSLGLGSGGSSGKTDYTDAEATRFNGLPGKPELWQDTTDKVVYAVYFVPDTDPPVPMLFQIPDNEVLKSLFGDKSIKYDRKMTDAEITSTGGIIWGSTTDIPAAGGDPWVGFVEKMERAAETQPWLRDPEVFGVHAAAYLMGRPPEKFELEATEWWQSRNQDEQEWAWLVARNPQEAARVREGNEIEVFSAFQRIGIMEPAEELVKYMADRFTVGAWSQRYLQEQMTAIINPDATWTGVDEGLAKLISSNNIDVGDPTVGNAAVRDMFREWLGPSFPPTEDQVSRWAAEMRRDDQAATENLTEHLRSQRLAMFPEYADDSLTYEDIASPWRSFQTQIWGQTPDELSDTFQRLVRLNDVYEGGKFLRKQGLEENVGKVRKDALRALGNEVSQVRQPV